MSLDLLNTAEATPNTFYRGATLEFLMELPQTIAASFFTDANSTLTAKLRLIEQAGAGGLITDLRPTWETGTLNTKIRFLAKTYNTVTLAWDIADTSAWPLGSAEFDLLITRTVDGVTKKYRSLPVKITIADGVS